MGQHVRAVSTGLAPCFRVASGRDPDRQFFGNRPWLCDDLVQLAIFAGETNSLASPQLAHLLNRVKHGGLVLGWRVFGPEHKIVRLPTACNGKPGAPIGQVIDNRPFLGYPRWMVKRGYATASPHTDLFGNRGDRRTGDRWVRVGAAERVEVAFRCPNGTKPVLIRKFRTFQQQAILVAPGTVIITPIIDGKVHARAGSPRCSARYCATLAGAWQHNLDAARHRVKQLEHRNIKA